jgi:hypothetical protein
MKFLLSLTADNAAFHDGDCEGEHLTNMGSPVVPCECLALRLELSTILRTVAKQIARDGLSGFFETIRDSNGNSVGTYAIKPDHYA